jgi:hypothetical protein
MMMRYWFKPKRFWRWFAAYYPIRWQGWLVTLGCAGLLVYAFTSADTASSSLSDALISFGPRAIVVLILFDAATRLAGEYPWWWKKKENKNA